MVERRTAVKRYLEGPCGRGGGPERYVHTHSAQMRSILGGFLF